MWQDGEPLAIESQAACKDVRIFEEQQTKRPGNEFLEPHLGDIVLVD